MNDSALPHSRPPTTPTGDSKDEEVDLWNNLLKSVASNKIVSTKNVLLLGNDGQVTKSFVESLHSVVLATQENKSTKSIQKTPVQCQYGLGYTYFDIEDFENEETLARVGFHMLPKHGPSTQEFLKGALVGNDLTETMVCLLLDWHHPWTWMAEIRAWVRSLQTCMKDLRKHSRAIEITLDEIQKNWEMRIRRYTETPNAVVVSAAQHDPELALPLSEGQYDEPLGLPLMCVCCNADYTSVLEREYGMKEEQFDFIQQSLRTVLMKHGAAIHYLGAGSPHTALLALESLQSMLSIPTRPGNQSSNIRSTIRTVSVNKGSVLDRDQVYIPPGWDSWGKIKILRTGFDVESTARGWSIDVDLARNVSKESDKEKTELGAVDVYEEVVINPKLSTHPKNSILHGEAFLTNREYQDFLQEMETTIASMTTHLVSSSATGGRGSEESNVGTLTSSVLGPMQSHSHSSHELDTDEIEDKLKRLRMRAQTPSLTASPQALPGESVDGSKTENAGGSSSTTLEGNRDEVVANFFQNLLKRTKESGLSAASPSTTNNLAKLE